MKEKYTVYVSRFVHLEHKCIRYAFDNTVVLTKGRYRDVVRKLKKRFVKVIEL